MSTVLNFIDIENDCKSATVVTPRLLHFAIFCQMFERIRLKTLLNMEIPPDCYTFLTFFCIGKSLLHKNRPTVLAVFFENLTKNRKT